MKRIFFIFCLSFSFWGFAQEEEDFDDESVFIDEKYFEDQFYIGIQYSSLISNYGVSNNGIPYGFEVGFIKDIPINKQRNLGFGLGVGYSYDVIRPNITITQNGDALDYNVSNDFSSYKYTSNNLEFPLEFRWRTSTARKISFWRVYTGGSLVYNLNNKAEFDTGTEDTSYTNLDSWNTINYTLYTSIGYGTWNFHIKYYLNSPFKDDVLSTSGGKLNFHPLKVGFMFYIL